MSFFRLIFLLIYLPLNIQCGTDPSESEYSPNTGSQTTEESGSQSDVADEIKEVVEPYNSEEDDISEFDEEIFTDSEEPEEPEIDGYSLYADNCAACHGAIENSSKRDKTASQIENAIANVDSMMQFSVLTNDEIQAISDALSD